MSIDSIKPYAKAVVAFVTPGAIAAVAAMQDGSAGGSSIVGAEWLSIVLACLLTGGAVYGTPNRDPRGLKQDESVQPPTTDYLGKAGL